MTEPFKFQVGDEVEWCGVKGTVRETNYSMGKSLGVRFGGDNATLYWFYENGDLEFWHIEPSLKLINRPKKKVRKELHGWINIFSPGDPAYWATREQADTYSRGRVACVEFRVPYEVEE